MATSVFGYQHRGPTDVPWYQLAPVTETDAYKFYMDLGPLSNSKKYYGKDNFFWHQLVEHPNYDTFWKKRGIVQHLKNVHTNVMTVGGWFDAEDLYGPLNIYQAIEKNNPNTFNCLVMGPWSHGATVSWSQGTTRPWCHGTTGPWSHGTTGSRSHGATGPRSQGAMEPLGHGVTGSWSHGATEQWSHGELQSHRARGHGMGPQGRSRGH